MKPKSIAAIVAIIVVLGIVAAVVGVWQSTGVDRDVTTPASLESQSVDP
jgi:hypothetical protein